DIPVLGYLFRSTSNTTTKRNLMVFIRPTILRDANVYSGISSNKYSLFRAEQLNAAAQDSELTSPTRQVLPTYGQDVMLSPEVEQRLKQMQVQPQPQLQQPQHNVGTATPFLQGKP
ncbi:MAG: type II secretion system protein GspD, partial [Aeromonas sobria]